MHTWPRSLRWDKHASRRRRRRGAFDATFCMNIIANTATGRGSLKCERRPRSANTTPRRAALNDDAVASPASPYQTLPLGHVWAKAKMKVMSLEKT